jgi:hypothetical protein
MTGGSSVTRRVAVGVGDPASGLGVLPGAGVGLPGAGMI